MQQMPQTFKRLPPVFCERIQDESSTWAPGPDLPRLQLDEVHIWRIALDDASSLQPNALSNEDRIQGARFHFEIDHKRFLIARASLRVILGRYLKQAPATLEFRTSQYGKPALIESQNALDLHFNLSHSHSLALVAIARQRQIGVDIEHIRPDFAGDEIAERFFSNGEIGQLKSLSPDLRTEAFFNCWTRKEAYIKGRGEGLSFPLDQFDVSLEPNSKADLLANRLDPTETARWRLEALLPALNYAAAIAVENGFTRLRCWSLDTTTVPLLDGV